MTTLVAVMYVWKFAEGSMIYGNLAKYYPFVAMAIMVIILFLGNNLTAKHIRRLKSENLDIKLKVYKKEYGKRLKYFSAISLVAVVSMIVFANMFYVIFASLSFLLVATSRVYEVKVKYELNLSEEEIKKIDKLKL